MAVTPRSYHWRSNSGSLVEEPIPRDRAGMMQRVPMQGAALPLYMSTARIPLHLRMWMTDGSVMRAAAIAPAVSKVRPRAAGSSHRCRCWLGAAPCALSDLVKDHG